MDPVNRRPWVLCFVALLCGRHVVMVAADTITQECPNVPENTTATTITKTVTTTTTTTTMASRPMPSADELARLAWSVNETDTQQLFVIPAALPVIFAGISAVAAVSTLITTWVTLTRSQPSQQINGCDNEGCLCNALGPGVHANVFDNTCSTFFHCPGPKRDCGPGTLFNAQHNVCDWPYNIVCKALQA